MQFPFFSKHLVGPTEIYSFSLGGLSLHLQEYPASRFLFGCLSFSETRFEPLKTLADYFDKQTSPDPLWRQILRVAGKKQDFPRAAGDSLDLPELSQTSPVSWRLQTSLTVDFKRPSCGQLLYFCVATKGDMKQCASQKILAEEVLLRNFLDNVLYRRGRVKTRNLTYN